MVRQCTELLVHLRNQGCVSGHCQGRRPPPFNCFLFLGHGIGGQPWDRKMPCGHPPAPSASRRRWVHLPSSLHRPGTAPRSFSVSSHLRFREVERGVQGHTAHPTSPRLSSGRGSVLGSSPLSQRVPVGGAARTAAREASEASCLGLRAAAFL